MRPLQLLGSCVCLGPKPAGAQAKRWRVDGMQGGLGRESGITNGETSHARSLFPALKPEHRIPCFVGSGRLSPLRGLIVHAPGDFWLHP